MPLTPCPRTKAHLPSLIYIYPKTPKEVAECLQEPIGAAGAHVHFEETVVTLEVQDSVRPDGAPSAPHVATPGASSSRSPTPSSYPPLVVTAENPYNDVDVVRQITVSLRPQEGD